MTMEFDNKTEPGDWEPEAHEREYVTQSGTGQLGWLVKRAGVDKVRLDRGSQEIVVKYDPNTWQHVREHRPFSRAQMAVVAFDADKALLRLLGDHDRSRRDWIGLSDKVRVAYIEDGPSNPPIRRMLYNAIMEVLERNLKG